jgi:hypothetical protein
VEGAAEALEALQLGRRHRLAARVSPERQNRERERGVETGLVTAADRDLPKVEEHPVVEVPLIHVAPDLGFVGRQPLTRGLRVEDEGMADHVGRREVGLSSRCPELLEIFALREAENVLDQAAENRFREDLLVRATSRAGDVIAVRADASKLLVDTAIVVEALPQCFEPGLLVKGESRHCLDSNA